MAEKNFHVKRGRNRQWAKDDLDPRMIVGAGYGEFAWAAIDDDFALWSFETEKARNDFIKAYGGEVFVAAPPPSYHYGAPYYGCPPPADPDCDLRKYFWDRK